MWPLLLSAFLLVLAVVALLGAARLSGTAQRRRLAAGDRLAGAVADLDAASAELGDSVDRRGDR